MHPLSILIFSDNRLLQLSNNKRIALDKIGEKI